MSDEPDCTSVDPFALEKIFDDPQGLLDHECVPIEEVKNEAVVCLDANVLLLPHQFSGMSLNAMIGVYRQLAERRKLKIPARAAQEYLKHRAEKIADIDKSLADHISKNRSPLNQINFMEGNKDIKEIREFEKEIKGIEKKISSRIEKLRSNLNGEVGSDPISEAYRTVLSNSVVRLKAFDPKIFMEDLEYRYKNKIPPGYMDSSKLDRGVGDLLIWKTILEIGAEEKCHLIFVTADSKGDWWTKRGDSERARLELVEEYRVASAGKSFYLLKLSDVLKLFGVGSTDIESIKDAEENLIKREIEKARLDHVYQVEKRARFMELQSKINRMNHLAEKYGDRASGYVPGFVTREISELEEQIERLQNSSMDSRHLRNAFLHSREKTEEQWVGFTPEGSIVRRCKRCGNQRASLGPNGELYCARCEDLHGVG